MKTTARTILPDNTHERPVYELKRKWFRWNVYFASTTALLINCYYWRSFYFNPSPKLVKAGEPGTTMVIFLVMSSLAIIMAIVIMAALGDIYFYDQYVEIRRFLPFMKRLVIYYDKMHVHIRQDGPAILNYYETPPKFWKSPYTWLKIYHSESIKLPLNCGPKIFEFLKTKAQSANDIKKPARTRLPDNTHKQPVYELRQSRLPFYQITIVLLVINAGLWWLIPFSQLIKESAQEIVIVLAMPVIFLLACIWFVLRISTRGDVYFYEGYVERRGLLQFMKRRVMYYEKMHVYIVKRPDSIVLMPPVFATLTYRETSPKLWSYKQVRANHFENINLLFNHNHELEIVEFLKTKTRSVNYY